MTKDNDRKNNHIPTSAKLAKVGSKNISNDIADISLDKLLSEIKHDSHNLASQSHDRVKAAIMEKIKSQPRLKLNEAPSVNTQAALNTANIVHFTPSKEPANNYRLQSLLAMTSLAASLMIGIFFGMSNNVDPYINTTLEIAGINIDEETSLMDIIDKSNS